MTDKKDNRPRVIHSGRDSVYAKLDADGNLIAAPETKGPKVNPETGAYEPAKYPVKGRSTWETAKPVVVNLTRQDN